MNNLVGNPQLLVGKLFVGFVCDRNGPFDAPAKPKCLSESNGDIVAPLRVLIVADLLH